MTNDLSPRVTRRLEWDAMHRLHGHEGKCKAFHGHRYAAEITVRAESLDRLGRVVDFSVLKSEVGGWIDRNWDHTAILERNDPDPAVAAIAESNARHGLPVYFLDAPPTVENITLELARISKTLLEPVGVRLVAIRIWETPNASALWEDSE